jgi:hypothetical protein
MNQNLMYFPCLAMMILTLIVMIRMFVMRVLAVKNKEVEIKYFKTHNMGGAPALMLQADRHFVNLFEAPVLFYMVCTFSVITFQVNYKMLCVAWIYVALRCIHAFIHVTSNKIRPRMYAYAFSWIALLYMGLSLGYKLLLAAVS